MLDTEDSLPYVAVLRGHPSLRSSNPLSFWLFCLLSFAPSLSHPTSLLSIISRVTLYKEEFFFYIDLSTRGDGKVKTYLSIGMSVSRVMCNHFSKFQVVFYVVDDSMPNSFYCYREKDNMKYLKQVDAIMFQNKLAYKAR